VTECDFVSSLIERITACADRIFQHEQALRIERKLRNELIAAAIEEKVSYREVARAARRTPSTVATAAGKGAVR
jgi:hypothetical protein